MAYLGIPLLTESGLPILQENGQYLFIDYIFVPGGGDDGALPRLPKALYQPFVQSVVIEASLPPVKIEGGFIRVAGAARKQILQFLQRVAVGQLDIQASSKVFAGTLQVTSSEGEVFAIGIKDISDEDLLLMLLDL